MKMDLTEVVKEILYEVGKRVDQGFPIYPHVVEKLKKRLEDILNDCDKDLTDLEVNFKSIPGEVCSAIRKEEAHTFEGELTDLINRYSKENDSDTPDFILASYLTGCLDIFSKTIQERLKWYS